VSGRVCVLRQNYFPAEAHVRKNVEALQEAGFEVDVVCLREKGAPAHDRHGSGRVTRLPLTHRRAGKARYLLEYVAFLVMSSWLIAWRSLRRRYDVVEAYNIPDALVFAALPAKLRGSKVVLYLFELMPEQVRDEYGLGDGHPLVRLLRWIERRSVRFADRVVCVSPYDAGIVTARSAPRRAPAVVLNVPEERLFSRLPEEEEAQDARLRLVTHGSILKRYGIETLIRAMPLIRERAPGAEAWIIGEGEYRDDLQSLAANLGLEESVLFLDWRPIEEIPALLRQTDIGVVPAEVPWLLPNKLFEYVALGKPVVASESPSVRSIFPDGEISYFAPGDATELAQRVMELHESRALRRERIDKAAAALAACRWEVSKQTYTAVHRELAGMGK
jgi:glycosyltransferase involved in cell wall biosynthesis